VQLMCVWQARLASSPATAGIAGLKRAVARAALAGKL
jgi:hypothetical protein